MRKDYILSGDESITVHPRDLGLSLREELHRFDVRRYSEIFANTPWYHERHGRSLGLLPKYAHGSKCLPDGLGRDAVWNRDYTSRLVISFVALKPHHQPRPEPDKGLSMEFV